MGAELPFGARKRWASGGISRFILGGWQVNGLLAAYSGPPFSVTADGTSLNAPGNAQTADQVKASVQTIGTRDSWFDPLVFVPVSAARFGTTGFNIVRAPGLLNLDTSLFRDFVLTERFKLQFQQRVVLAAEWRRIDQKLERLYGDHRSAEYGPRRRG